jgi:hypothetical protein
MAHGYFDIDLNIVWDTVQLSLPDLENVLRAASIPQPRGLKARHDALADAGSGGGLVSGGQLRSGDSLER